MAGYPYFVNNKIIKQEEMTMKEEIASYLAVEAILKIKEENLSKAFLPQFEQMIHKEDIDGAEKLADSLPHCRTRTDALVRIWYLRFGGE